jgi:predicted nucleic acid-binding protein
VARQLTLDAGALIALERRNRRVSVLIDEVKMEGGKVFLPSTVLAQAVRDLPRQVPLSKLLKEPHVIDVALDREAAVAVGRLLAATATADIADAHVVACARRHPSSIVTSDPGDLRRLDRSVVLVEI